MFTHHVTSSSVCLHTVLLLVQCVYTLYYFWFSVFTHRITSGSVRLHTVLLPVQCVCTQYYFRFSVFTHRITSGSVCLKHRITSGSVCLKHRITSGSVCLHTVLLPVRCVYTQYYFRFSVFTHRIPVQCVYTPYYFRFSVFTHRNQSNTPNSLGNVIPAVCQDGLLRVGGHQVPLRSGMPNVKLGIANLKHTDLDNMPAIPGCSILIRILPASDVSVGCYCWVCEIEIGVPVLIRILPTSDVSVGCCCCLVCEIEIGVPFSSASCPDVSVGCYCCLVCEIEIGVPFSAASYQRCER